MLCSQSSITIPSKAICPSPDSTVLIKTQHLSRQQIPQLAFAATVETICELNQKLSPNLILLYHSHLSAYPTTVT